MRLIDGDDILEKWEYEENDKFREEAVVRCKDCKYYGIYKCPMCGKAQEYDFCSYGGRKYDSCKD